MKRLEESRHTIKQFSAIENYDFLRLELMDVDGMDHRRHHFSLKRFKFKFCSSFNFGERES